MREYTGETISLSPEDRQKPVIIVTEAALRYVMEEIVPRVVAIIAFSAAFLWAWCLFTL